MTPARLAQSLRNHENLMAMIEFGYRRGLQVTTDPRIIQIPLEPLGNTSLIEVWYSHEVIETGEIDQIRFCKNPSAIFAQLCLDEHEYANLHDAAFDGYRRLTAFLHQQDYLYPLRIWNYFNDINAIEGAANRYQNFCRGRHRALQDIPELERRLPAATVIGTQTPAFIIYLLAAKTPGIQVENPRQVSAFHYPRRYGPISPSFSRATIKHWGRNTHLYISGTASIVGHQSRHRGNTLAQLDETLRNLEALIDHSRRTRKLAITGLRDLNLAKVYLHHPALEDSVVQQLKLRLGADVTVAILRGDVCRAELLLEIEGIYTEK